MRAPWSSLPGETPIDLSHLTAMAKSLGISNRNELNALEAQNIAQAFIKYLSATPTKNQAPFDYSWVLKVHREMFGDVWQWAGEIRQFDTNIGISFYKISAELYGLLNDLHEWPGFKMPLAEQAARLHHRAVAIHPFPNGNGRWSRLLANIWFKRHRSPLTVWPEDSIGEQGAVRKEYLSAIVRADAGDYTPLIELHTRFAKNE